MINDAAPIIHVFVASVLWSDGSFLGNLKFPRAVEQIIRASKQHAKQAIEATWVAAILNSRSEDTDIQHRIAEVITRLQSLPDKCAPGSCGGDAHNVVTNLKILASSAHPKEAFEDYRAFSECQSK